MHLFLRFLRFIIPRLAKSRLLRNWFNKYFSMFELFTWLLLSLWFLPFMMHKHIYAGSGLLLIILSIFIWIAWFGLKDLIAGFIFKTNSGLHIAEQIEIGEYKGVIIKLGFRNLILETPEGNYISIPFSQIINKPIIKVSSAEIRHNRIFDMEVKRVENIQKLTQEIAQKISMHPRSSILEQPKVELIGESGDNLTLRLKIYAVENKYLSLIEEDIRSAFEA
jgi:small-conductance mechanosensitive channel